MTSVLPPRDGKIPSAGDGEILRELVVSLRDRGRFDHPAEHREIIETHISYILLTGKFAYKFKKPLDLGFLDFTTLDRRRHYCEEELRLNRRLAAGHYLDIVRVTGSLRHPRIGGAGPALEYAVRMVQFPRDMELDTLCSGGRLSTELIDRLAERVAEFHRTAAIAEADSRFGAADSITQAAAVNFQAISKSLEIRGDDATRLRAIESWTLAACKELEAEFVRRKSAGRVRECHGDMHLGNMVLHDGNLVIFDCIEFSDELRWIDVMSEIAFLVMDLDFLRQTASGWRFLNAYLERSGDYGGLSVLRFYRVYRALVRAKVAAIRLGQASLAAADRHRETVRLKSHLDLAWNYLRRPGAALLITHGLSGSGKTWLTQHLIEKIGAVRMRSDVERKRMHGLPAIAGTGSGIDEGIYSATSGDAVYARLLELAAGAIETGYRVIVDATFLQRRQRQRFFEYARDRNIPFLILHLDASESTLNERIRRRAAAGADASEADREVLRFQAARQEPPGEAELNSCLRVDTEGGIDFERLARAIDSTMAAVPREALSGPR